MENSFLILGFKRLSTLNSTFADKMLLTPHTHILDIVSGYGCFLVSHTLPVNSLEVSMFQFC